MSVDIFSALRPYRFHGLQFKLTSKNALATCPFCGRPKFSVRLEDGVAICWGCPVLGRETPRGGVNILSFLRLLWRHYAGQRTIYEPLSKERKLLPETLIDWGICWSSLTKCWLLPGYDPKGQICQLYRYDMLPGQKKRVFLATPELHHGLFRRLQDYPLAETVYICEGVWDGMALSEALMQQNQRTIDGTGSASILCVPGASVFPEAWVEVLKGKSVYLLYDNDEAGRTGAQRTAGMLSSAAKEVFQLVWEEGTPNGYDLRDYFQAGRLLCDLRKLIKPIQVPLLPQQQLLNCRTYDQLVAAWRQALFWTSGLDHALAVMLAVVASTESLGDQLWVKILGPAACGKSILSEALSTNTNFVLPKSTIRGFFSGWRDASNEDAGLINRLRGKTLIVKDGDTLLQSPNLAQILSEGRDLYDGVSRTHYRNRVSWDYTGIRMTWLLCGTPSLRAIDHTELGERFLDCIIAEEVEESLENQIAWHAINRVDQVAKTFGNHDPYAAAGRELSIAMRMTGGYVEYLRRNAKNVLPTIVNPEESKRQILDLARLVAYLRARPRLGEITSREFCTRIAGQLVRLARCLAYVLNRPEVDEFVMARVRKVAFDTAQGKSLQVVKALLNGPPEGMTLTSLSIVLSWGESSLRQLVRFLARLKVINYQVPADRRPRWFLTKSFRQLAEKYLASL